MTKAPISDAAIRAETARAKPIIREHKIPTPDSKPYIAVEGPDGNLWFCENGASKIGCFDPRAGAFREFALPAAGSMPVGIAVGGDGNLWFTEKEGNRIGRITLGRRDRGVRACRPPKPVLTVSSSDLTAIFGSPRATPIASRGLPATAASPSSASA